VSADPASWLEIALVVDGELAEAVAEVLARYAPAGVAIEAMRIEAGVEDEGRAVGPLRVSAYLPVDAALEATRQRLAEALWYLGRIRPLPEPEFRFVQETDWAEAWKAHYQPIKIGQRLIVVPAWLASPEPQRIAIQMDPGMAFGTGTHPSTQLCLEYLERLMPTAACAAPVNLIDVGCGSGILAIAALKLGAARALGVDIDPLAVRVARQNAQLNGVGERLELGKGSVGEIRAGAFGLQTAHLVVANILAPVILRLFDEGLGELVVPSGTLVMAGILAEQAAQVEAAALNTGLMSVGRLQQGDWVALACQRLP
jgi:ribosomal protein L11 methyltransferase